jgi:ABC-type transport system involved in cytochrome bd biosynthesis fused ATPase/permease subunit
VLQNASLSLNAGSIVALIGPSGSGKSTWLGIASGTFMPFGGSIFINGIQFSWEEYRKARVSSYVDQEVRFFDGSIRENLVLGKHVDEKAIYKMLSSAGLEEVVRAFPKGLDSEINSVSRELSGGQFQRLSVVRALLSQKPLILLDEPTSSLDEESEAKIAQLIKENRQGRIFLVSTHSARLTEIADAVIDVRSGEA